MTIVFDLDFDAGAWPGPRRGRAASAGEDWVGPLRLLQRLESELGLAGPALDPRERAARLVPALRRQEGFWSRSAEVDPFATARRLLEWRDTLAMGGWRHDGTEPRLAQLGALMADAAPGIPDRLSAVAASLARRGTGVARLEMRSPRAELAPMWHQVLDRLQAQGTAIVDVPVQELHGADGRDVSAVRAGQFLPAGDGSLRLLRPAGPLEAAEEVAAWLALIHGKGETETLIIGGDPALDAALRRHGLPTLGTPHPLRDGVPLQVLPIVLDLGWAPQNPQRAYELLALPAGPVPGELRWRLRAALAQWPAVDSDVWRTALADGLAAIDDSARRLRAKTRMDVMWEAPVTRGAGYPVAEVRRRVELLRTWIAARLHMPDADTAAWAAALAQCDTVGALVQHSGLDTLTNAQLRHLVVEATDGAIGRSPFPQQAGLGFVREPGAVAGPARTIVWWDFSSSAAPSVNRLPFTRAERLELAARGVPLPEPGAEAAAYARRWRRPLEQAVARLLLVCPEKGVDGEERHPHPLWDEVVSRVAASNTRRVADTVLMRRSMADVVEQTRRACVATPGARRDWTVAPGRIGVRETESPSSVETLLACPFRWVLRYAGRLPEPESAEIDAGTGALALGRLLHDIMNRLFAMGSFTPDVAERAAGEIFDREGPRLTAGLFLPGAEAQRARVRGVARRTARRLFGLLAAGGLEVVASEETRTAPAFGTRLEGRVDLILGDPPRILDLKWGSAATKRQSLEAGAAVQLAAYAYLVRQGRGEYPPVGYFVMDEQRLLTTQPGAFPGAESVQGTLPEEVWHTVEATHRLEWEAVSRGKLEARGIDSDEGEPITKPVVKDGYLRLPAMCQWCNFGGLCGRDLEEGV
jgi:ATP-dependent helicase/nuclease subunit B